MAEHLYNFSLAEEREHYASLLDCLRQSQVNKDLSVTRVAYRAAAHVPLPVITMSNSAVRRFSRLNSTVNTTSRSAPRSSVGAGYRCGVRASQTQKSAKNRFFSGACGPPSPARKRLRRSLYIGAILRFATACWTLFSPAQRLGAAEQHLSQ